MTRVALATVSFTRSIPHRILANNAIAAGVIVAVLVALPHTAQAQLPSINIRNTCQAAAGVMLNLMGGSSMQNDVEICLETENKARQQILKDWSTFDSSDRAGCVQAGVYLPSYIEWLTCFEMNKVVREARRAQGRAVPDASAAVVLPRVRSGRPVN